MSIGVHKTTGETYKPVFLKILEDIPGGVTLAVNRVPSWCKELKAGLCLVESANTTGLYQFIKVAKALSTQATGTVHQYHPGCLFNVGDAVILSNKTTAVTVTRVARTANTTYIAYGANIGTMTSATRLVEAAAAGATTLKYDPSCMLRDNVRVRWDDLETAYNPTAGAVVRAGVQETRLPYYVTTRMQTKLGARFRFA